MSSERFVVITDLEHDFTGWAVEVTQDDDVHIAPISAKSLYATTARISAFTVKERRSTALLHPSNPALD